MENYLRGRGVAAREKVKEGIGWLQCSASPCEQLATRFGGQPTAEANHPNWIRAVPWLANLARLRLSIEGTPAREQQADGFNRMIAATFRVANILGVSEAIPLLESRCPARGSPAAADCPVHATGRPWITCGFPGD
jgi:hypothetical protein